MKNNNLKDKDNEEYNGSELGKQNQEMNKQIMHMEIMDITGYNKKSRI